MQNEKKNILEVKELSVNLEKQNILSDINFSVLENETMAIIGPNGAGKSILFRALLGLIPYRGKVSWKEGVRIGYVPQKLSIEKGFPLSVKEFLSFKGNKGEVERSITATGINGHAILNKKLSALSGGELQRIMIAWAVMGNPDVLLFDEPLAGIDIGGEETIYNLIYDLNRKLGTTLLIISHDLGVMYKYTNKILCLNKKQMCLGRPNEVLNEETERKLYGSMSTFHGHTHEFNKGHDEK